MKKTNFRSSINYDHTTEKYESTELESETVPDQSLTIPEMIKRHASGRPINVKVYDEYDGGGDDLTGVDIRTLDMSEIHDLVARTTDNLAKFNYEKDRRRKEQQDADLEKSIIAKYEARRKELEPDPGPSRPVFVQPVLPGIEPKKGA
jgi:hypothetical protein